MKLALYNELVPWYRLLDPTEEHRNEAHEPHDSAEHAALQQRAILAERDMVRAADGDPYADWIWPMI